MMPVHSGSQGIKAGAGSSVTTHESMLVIWEMGIIDDIVRTDIEFTKGAETQLGIC